MSSDFETTHRSGGEDGHEAHDGTRPRPDVQDRDPHPDRGPSRREAVARQKELTTGGIIAAVLLIVVTLLGAILGGLVGMRFHRTVDKTGLGD